MWPESSETKQALRSGLTTGTCATACCVAASQSLLAGKQPKQVEVTLPRGKQVSLTLEAYSAVGPDRVKTSTIKDAGDDPDVTHGACVFVELALIKQPGVVFKAGAGVGTVTKSGLVLGIGEPAINPVPRKMMQQHLQSAAEVYQYSGGFEVTVGIEKGEQLALKTMNPRLGILGGLSVLGTTGIVRPYSCAAYIASIHQGIDVARSNGIHHIAAVTGSTSEQFIQQHYQLDEMALLEMGDFVGAVLKHLRAHPIRTVSLCGGFGKITKLANGHMDLNSRASSIDFESLAQWAQQCGASDALLTQIRSANTSMEVLALCQQQNIQLGQMVCDQALQKARAVLAKVPKNDLRLEVWAVDRKGQLIASAAEPGQ